jgi:hypothetical protein
MFIKNAVIFKITMAYSKFLYFVTSHVFGAFICNKPLKGLWLLASPNGRDATRTSKHKIEFHTVQKKKIIKKVHSHCFTHVTHTT